jgi:type IV pilus assembly protein PilB
MLVDASILSRGPLIGQILLSLGKITNEQLAQALEMQKQNHRYIGEILVELGFIAREDIEKALCIQRHYEAMRSEAASKASLLSAGSK